MMNKQVTLSKIKIPATKSDAMVEFEYKSQRGDKVPDEQKLELDKSHLMVPPNQQMAKAASLAIPKKTVNIEDLEPPLPNNV